MVTSDLLNLAQAVWYATQTAQILKSLLPETPERSIREEYHDCFRDPTRLHDEEQEALYRISRLTK